MKNIKQLAIISLGGAVLLCGARSATAQSLGDAARAARKNKPETTSASHHYDNDNLPTNDTLSVVGPPPSTDPTGGTAATGVVSPTALKADPAAAAADRQKTADEFKKKIDQQKDKVDSLAHELDLQQREYRLRAASYYSDAGARLRDAAQWDKDDAQYKSDVEGKQKAIQAAQQQLDELQEQARKAGVEQKDKDKDDSTDKK